MPNLVTFKVCFAARKEIVASLPGYQYQDNPQAYIKDIAHSLKLVARKYAQLKGIDRRHPAKEIFLLKMTEDVLANLDVVPTDSLLARLDEAIKRLSVKLQQENSVTFKPLLRLVELRRLGCERQAIAQYSQQLYRHENYLHNMQKVSVRGLAGIQVLQREAGSAVPCPKDPLQGKKLSNDNQFLGQEFVEYCQLDKKSTTRGLAILANTYRDHKFALEKKKQQLDTSKQQDKLLLEQYTLALIKQLLVAMLNHYRSHFHPKGHKNVVFFIDQILIHCQHRTLLGETIEALYQYLSKSGSNNLAPMLYVIKQCITDCANNKPASMLDLVDGALKKTGNNRAAITTNVMFHDDNNDCIELQNMSMPRQIDPDPQYINQEMLENMLAAIKEETGFNTTCRGNTLRLKILFGLHREYSEDVTQEIILRYRLDAFEFAWNEIFNFVNRSDWIFNIKEITRAANDCFAHTVSDEEKIDNKIVKLSKTEFLRRQLDRKCLNWIYLRNFLDDELFQCPTVRRAMALTDRVLEFDYPFYAAVCFMGILFEKELRTFPQAWKCLSTLMRNEYLTLQERYQNSLRTRSNQLPALSYTLQMANSVDDFKHGFVINAEKREKAIKFYITCSHAQGLIRQRIWRAIYSDGICAAANIVYGEYLNKKGMQGKFVKNLAYLKAILLFHESREVNSDSFFAAQAILLTLLKINRDGGNFSQIVLVPMALYILGVPKENQGACCHELVSMHSMNALKVLYKKYTHKEFTLEGASLIETTLLGNIKAPKKIHMAMINILGAHAIAKAENVKNDTPLKLAKNKLLIAVSLVHALCSEVNQYGDDDDKAAVYYISRNLFYKDGDDISIARKEKFAKDINDIIFNNSNKEPTQNENIGQYITELNQAYNRIIDTLYHVLSYLQRDNTGCGIVAESLIHQVIMQLNNCDPEEVCQYQNNTIEYRLQKQFQQREKLAGIGEQSGLHYEIDIVDCIITMVNDRAQQSRLLQ